MLAMLLAERPKVVSFHFGVPSRERIAALRDAGIVLLGSATSVAEARALVAAGVDAVVAQGYEAGGHRGVFDPNADDDRLGTLALTRLLARDDRSARHRRGRQSWTARVLPRRSVWARARRSWAPRSSRVTSRRPTPATARR